MQKSIDASKKAVAIPRSMIIQVEEENPKPHRWRGIWNTPMRKLLTEKQFPDKGS